MTPEAMAYLAKARQCLSNARSSLGIGLTTMPDGVPVSRLSTLHKHSFSSAREKRQKLTKGFKRTSPGLLGADT